MHKNCFIITLLYIWYILPYTNILPNILFFYLWTLILFVYDVIWVPFWSLHKIFCLSQIILLQREWAVQKGLQAARHHHPMGGQGSLCSPHQGPGSLGPLIHHHFHPLLCGPQTAALNQAGGDSASHHFCLQLPQQHPACEFSLAQIYVPTRHVQFLLYFAKKIVIRQTKTVTKQVWVPWN